MMIPALFPFSLSISAGYFFLVLLVLLCIAYSVFAYARTVPEITRRKRAVLITLRSLALALLVFIVFEPVLNLLRTTSLEPRVAFIVDNSASMTIEDPGGKRADIVRAFAGGPDAAAVLGLGAVDGYRMAAKLTTLGKLSPDSLTFTGSETDIDGALRKVREDHEGKNLRAVVLVTDGVSTTGKNPLYAAQALGVPVYTVGVGDSAAQKDVLVGRIVANDLAYLESVLPVDVTIRATGVEQTTLQVTLFDGRTVVQRVALPVRQGDGEYPVHFQYTPKEEGIRKMMVEVSTVPGELTVKNNTRAFYVRVLKSRMTVALVASAPSPDVALFEQAIAKDKNVAVQSYVQKSGASWYAAAPVQKSFSEADCILLIGYPGPHSGDNTLQLIRTAVERDNKPLFIVFDREIDLGALRRHLDSWLPFDVVQSRADEMQASFVLAPDARQNPIVSSGIPGDVWDRLPPLFKTETSIKARVGAQTLGTMKINSIAFNEPMLLARRIGRSKTLAMTGYGLWRWQMAYDVLDGRVPDILIANAIRWLTTREENKRFTVKPAKDIFGGGEPVEFTGQVYNESYEPVSDAVVSVKIRGESGERDLALAPLGAGRYSGAVDGLPEGDYAYTATAAVGGATLTDAGKFSIGELSAEFLDTRMNNALLRQIAARTGGRFFPIGNTHGLAEAIKSAKDFTAQSLDIRTDIRLWNLVWLFALVVALFATEWYLRKQAGMV